MGRIASLEGTIEKMATMQAQLLNHLTQPVKAEPQQQTITNVAQAMPKADDHLAIFIEQMKVYRKANGLRKRQGVKMQIAADHLTRLMGTQVEDWTKSDTYSVAVEGVEAGTIHIGDRWSMRTDATFDADNAGHASKPATTQFVAHYQGR
jgi:hypothetical protein